MESLSDLLAVKLQNILEIWEGLDFRLPFIVRRDCWVEETFFVVRRIPCGGSKVLVFGDLYRGGQFIKSREGDALALSSRRVWVRLPFSWMPCVVIEAGICPIPEMQGAVCERVRNCSYLDDWMLHISYVNEESGECGLDEEI
jgi:hypothetical protein